MQAFHSRSYTFVLAKATQALALVLSLSILGCGVSSQSELDDDSDSQQALALAVPLTAPAAGAAVALGLPAVAAVAGASVVAAPLIFLYYAQQKQREAIELSIRTNLVQWVDDGLPSDRDWYSLAFQAVFPVSNVAADGEFATQFIYESSPNWIAALSNPYHNVYGSDHGEVSLAQVAALHSVVVAHVANPQTMLATAFTALVPTFMSAQAFDAHRQAILAMFTGYQVPSFQGVIDTDLALYTVGQLTRLSAMLQSATGGNSPGRTGGELNKISAQVHAAFLTGIFLAATTAGAALFPQHLFPEPLLDLVDDYSNLVRSPAPGIDHGAQLGAIRAQLEQSFGPQVPGLKELYAQVFFDAEYSFDLNAYVAEVGLTALSTQLQNLALVEVFRLYPELKIPLTHLVKGSTLGDMKKEVATGKAPREVDRVDDAHMEGQQPHVHIPVKGGKDVSINKDGTLGHDGPKLPDYRTSNPVKRWLQRHGWGTPIR